MRSFGVIDPCKTTSVQSLLLEIMQINAPLIPWRELSIECVTAAQSVKKFSKILCRVHKNPKRFLILYQKKKKKKSRLSYPVYLRHLLYS
jgi:hypothetical protein